MAGCSGSAGEAAEAARYDQLLNFWQGISSACKSRGRGFPGVAAGQHGKEDGVDGVMGILYQFGQFGSNA